MGKTIGLMTALCLILIALAASHYPSSPLFWNASTSTAFNILRSVVSLLLLILFVHVPRNKGVRGTLGLLSLLFIGWVWSGADMEVIDALILSAAAISIPLTLLESKPTDEPFKSMEFASVIRDILFEKIRFISAWEMQFLWLCITNTGLALDKRLTSVQNDIRVMHGHR